jgi:hypothetical protein
MHSPYLCRGVQYVNVKRQTKGKWSVSRRHRDHIYAIKTTVYDGYCLRSGLRRCNSSGQLVSIYFCCRSTRAEELTANLSCSDGLEITHTSLQWRYYAITSCSTTEQRGTISKPQCCQLAEISAA